MKAVIMAGGLGVRLKPYTEVIPKPLVPVAGKPVIDRIIEQLKGSGFTDIMVSINYKSDLVRTYLGKGEKHGVHISYIEEAKPLGPVGALKIVEKELTEDFLVINGDHVSEIDLKALAEFHLKNNSELTIATKMEKVDIPFGVITSDGERNITKYEERPVRDVEVVTGAYILSPNILKYIKDDEKLNMPELRERAFKDNKKIMSYLYDGFWVDMGEPNHVEKANQHYFKKQLNL